MYYGFDFFDQFERPAMVLCNPDKTPLYSLDLAYHVNFTARFNALSEISFDYPEYLEDQYLPAYAYLVSKRLIYIDGIGYFIITRPDEELSGKVNVKHVVAQSLEGELLHKKVTAFEGTYQFSGTPPAGLGVLMEEVLRIAPAWSLTYVDPLVADKARTFDVKDNTLYNFLMTDVATAYECVFLFNTVTRGISVYAKDNATTATGIYFSFDNLIKHIQLSEKSDEIATCLHVYGAGDLDVRTVNPLGGVKIYDFTYYKNTDWMSASLIAALDAWEDKVDAQQVPYANALTLYKNTNALLVTAQGELDVLNSEYAALNEILQARIVAGQDHSEIDAQMAAKQTQINSKTAEITGLEGTLASYATALAAINESLSFAQNFTSTQIAELSNYIFENTYQNENFVQTEIMTPVQVQEIAQELYDQAQVVIGRASQPRYEFTVESVNFLYLSEFEHFLSQMELGCTVKVEVREGQVADVILLEIAYSFDDPSVFSIKFGNRIRLDDNDFIFSDLFGPALKNHLGTTVSSAVTTAGETDYLYLGPNYLNKILRFENGIYKGSTTA
jgi:hypothetical protein